MYKYLIICVFWTGIGVNSLRIKEEEEENETKYKFEYSVRDPKTGNFQSRQEERVADMLRGQYSFHDPDGVKRTVIYKVDGPSGFIATVHKEKSPFCEGCKEATPFEVSYHIQHRSPDSFVRSYFYMGSGLTSSEVSVDTKGTRIFTRIRHP